MRRAFAVLLLVGIVVGTPVVLVVTGFYDWGSIGILVAADVRLLLAGLTVVAWLAWGLWIALLGLELVALLTSGRVHIRVPGLDWPQVLAGALLAAALSSAMPHSARAEAPEPVPVVSVEESQSPETEPAGEERDPRGASEAEPDGAEAADPAPDVEDEAVPDAPGHLVAEGDDLWSLAEAYYDDGRQWRRIVDANPHLAEDPTAELSAGTWLAVPEPVKLVTVRRGDTLSGLALKHLGDGNRWPEIFDLNRSRVADPDLIDIGWVLRIPREVATPAPAGRESTPPAVEHEVEIGHPEDGAETVEDAPDQAMQESALDDAEPGEAVTAAETPPSGRVLSPWWTPPESSGQPDAEEPSPETPDSVAEPEPVDSSQNVYKEPEVVGALVGGMSSLAASVVLGSVALRRSLRERSRPPGRRFAHPGAALRRVETALSVRQAAGRVQLIDRALRHLGAHWFAEGVGAPGLEQVLVSDAALEFTFDTEVPLPDGFTRLGDVAVVGWQTLESLPDIGHPAAFPALVTVGTDARGDLVMSDLVGAGVLGVRAGSASLATETLSAMLLELACAPWAEESELLVVTDDDGFARAAGGAEVVTMPDAAAAVRRIERWASGRRGQLETVGYDEARLDPVLADAWRPRVAVFEKAPEEPLVRRLESALAEPACGVAAALPVGADAGEARWRLSASGRRVRESLGRVDAPTSLPEETRRSLTELLNNAEDTTTNPAPWWNGQEEDVKIIELHPLRAGGGPLLRMLGPIDLVDAAGPAPERAARQCLEYCAWILENPGSTAVEMAASLLVADSTRRSNMSRLRAWLGEDADGNPYLPDAYSGRIHLADEVGSDWEQFRALIAPGVLRTSPERLRMALELVRGAPLADAAPGQWQWAEEMRSDMVASIRDVALVLARHARGVRDWELAGWAAHRGLAAAPEDELLMCERIRVEHARGHVDEVTRLVTRLTRSARALGVDLLPETVELCQEVMEGRLRARRA